MPEYAEVINASHQQWQDVLNGPPERAARWMETAAKYGDIDAQLKWAQMLNDGRGVASDPAAAFRWFAIAARSERADALNLLARCHETGLGVSIDWPKAAEIYRKASDKNSAWAQFNLACMLLDGRGAARDPDQAFTLLMAAAAQDHVKSFNMIGMCYEHGWGCAFDPVSALQWYRRSAERGDFRGQFSLARALVAQGSIDDARHWFEMAAASTPPHLCDELATALRGFDDARIRQIAKAVEARTVLTPA